MSDFKLQYDEAKELLRYYGRRLSAQQPLDRMDPVVDRLVEVLKQYNKIEIELFGDAKQDEGAEKS